ncbi:hypothetical protein K5V07_14100 [Flavobacterium sp. CHNK8]|uniref:rolling circle replication-associated protein n=1 Tax=Flavobacterium sp. CHNK8 TaxID=2871165 RepID=UPI001C8DB34C|nr:hypothetical protein [Flavobacterium sp. CHNK8]QZK91571.1 hypothetical protein K5V07_14100 [Flavobacterium sp. CHNK8]
MIVKNTYGTSVAFSVREFGVIPKEEFTGSALQRKKKPPAEKNSNEKTTPKPKPKADKKKEVKLRFLSKRSKQKIRKKLICFARCYKRLSFVTLTFLNEVSDEQAVNILRKFIDNVKKRSENFQYIWVAERQTKNDTFKGNIHFHMITNKYWKIEKWWNYWLDLQRKNGIIPRDENYKPSSAFDVRQLNSNNIRSIASYITKYVTKNNDKFKCQVWNCSRQVSELYTDFYTDSSFVDEFKKLDAVLKEFEVKDHSNRMIINIKMINLNRQTLPLYKRLDEKNKAIPN